MSKFNWQDFLAVGRKRRSEDEWGEALDLADDWNTCACGSLDDGIPRYGGTPCDDGLYNLGVDFAIAIDDRNLPEARRLFAKIQQRGAEVLAEQS